ncbi:DNA-binding WRKY [Macleaya cordata]|uniref:DNA-binding WRKY n=1 Tax=Macleaya cordata TaxID=56857 RepID=A0A200R696_MACCD|nr:DNA-binding WRKY [Macleaya cordata]
MELKDTDKRKIIAKPVASRPSCSKFQSFSALLTGAINTSPPASSSETAVAAIRPKTVRLKPSESWASTGIVSSQGEASGTAAVCYSSDKPLKSEIKSNVVFKPLAKLVSRTTVSQLANLGNSDTSHQQATVQLQPCVQHSDQAKHHVQTPPTSDLHRNLSSPVRMNQIMNDSSKLASRRPKENQRDLLPTTSGDRPSYDGYNWRKYGQKQVKGSEYPRSYYKCTHPNCPVKKKVERTFDGQIAEIVYKGEHNHSKPQPPKRHSSGTPEQGLGSDGTGQETSNTLWSSSLNERNEGSESRMENYSSIGFSVNPSYTGKAPMIYDSVTTGAFNNSLGTPDNSCGLSGDYDEGSRRGDAEDDEPKFKQRKKEHQSSDGGIVPQGVPDPRVVLQASTDAEILGDGFRWRKYGQKVVKGNPHPRSYYRCSSLKCNVRKHVERSLDDPSAFITTYEGKHNHGIPSTRNLNSSASDPDSAAPSYKANQ